jgi:hypothetical protein
MSTISSSPRRATTPPPTPSVKVPLDVQRIAIRDVKWQRQRGHLEGGS